MKLPRYRRTNAPRISLVAMVDVLMIMLVFFMVTSQYLDLDMLTLAGGAGADLRSTPASSASDMPPLLVRLDDLGRVFVRSWAVETTRLESFLTSERQRNPDIEVVLIASGQASVQSLASTMDALAAAGTSHVRVVGIAGQP